MAKIIKEESALGATIQEIDLKNPLDNDLKNFIIKAFAENEVIFFRDQDISPEQHRAFASNFGKLQNHPVYPTVSDFPEITILENNEKNPSKIEKWHTDMTFKKIPPLGSILLGKVIPEKGGDTLFASLSAAYNDLSNDSQEYLLSHGLELRLSGFSFFAYPTAIKYEYHIPGNFENDSKGKHYLNILFDLLICKFKFSC